MNNRFLAVWNTLAVAAALFLVAGFLAAQASSPGPNGANAAAGATSKTAPQAAPAAKVKAWTMPRTPDGHPDLQGVWSTATLTPLERPADLGSKEFFTQQEAVDYAKKKMQTNAEVIDNGLNSLWFDRGNQVVPTLRTSLIVDPPDGRIPPLTPEGKKRAQARADAQHARGPADSYLYFNLAERCITRGIPRTPGAYNNNQQIVQSPNAVAILYEMIHDARVIPLDGRPHLGKNLQQWRGNSIGHWEGDTLVVDTTNYNDQFMNNINDCCGGAGAHLHIVERFRRIDANNIDYRFTVDDPTTFTKPWTVALPMYKTDDQIYEYECSESNYFMMHALVTARTEEKAAAEGAAKDPH